MSNIELIDKLDKEKKLSREEWIQLIGTYSDSDRKYAGELAQKTAIKHFGKNR